jgi:cytoskeletal protein RodZ
MADIGATLREARMRSRIDINEVETRTKIRAKYLRAIENEEWDLLPGPVYIKSFLRTYGDYLGLDSRMLVDEYKRRYERPSDHDLRPIATLGRERERAARGPLLPPWAVIGLVLVGLVVVLYIVGNNTNKSPAPTTSASTNGAHRPRRKPNPVVPVAPPAPTTAKLELVPTSTVYVCLVDGTGKHLINAKDFSAGQTIPPFTAPKLLLTLGNNAIQMKVNGHAVNVPATANGIRYLIGPTGQRRIPLAASPPCP